MKYIDISMIDMAYKILKEQKEINFIDLWNKILKEFEFNEEEAKNKKIDFYNQLTIDGRFIFKDNNILNLA